jgi:hypothetical protein
MACTGTCTRAAQKHTKSQDLVSEIIDRVSETNFLVCLMAFLRHVLKMVVVFKRLLDIPAAFFCENCILYTEVHIRNCILCTEDVYIVV